MVLTFERGEVTFRMRRFFPSLLLLGAFVFLAAQEEDEREGAGGLIGGPGYSFVIGAPKGWLFDTKYAYIVGAKAVMYPVETDLTTTDVIIYANAFPLEGKSLETWVTEDNARLSTDYPGVAITRENTLETADSLLALVRSFAPEKSAYELYERTAYVRMDQTVAVISLSAQSEDAFERSISAFEFVVKGLRKIEKSVP